MEKFISSQEIFLILMFVVLPLLLIGCGSGPQKEETRTTVVHHLRGGEQKYWEVDGSITRADSHISFYEKKTNKLITLYGDLTVTCEKTKGTKNE